MSRLSFFTNRSAHTPMIRASDTLPLCINATHDDASMRLHGWLLKPVINTPAESPIFIYELRATILTVCIALE